jgi:hypothetical protein
MTTWPGGLRTQTTPQSAIANWARDRTAEDEARRRHACYICGAMPELVDATAFGDPGPTYISAGWPAPAEGHEHATRPPTPEELAAAGHASLRRILEE